MTYCPLTGLRRGQGVPGRASRESRSLEPKGEGKGTKNRQGGKENFPLDVSGLKAHKDPPCNCFWCSVDMVLSQDRGDSRTEVWVRPQTPGLLSRPRGSHEPQARRGKSPAEGKMRQPYTRLSWQAGEGLPGESPALRILKGKPSGSCRYNPLPFGVEKCQGSFP